MSIRFSWSCLLVLALGFALVSAGAETDVRLPDRSDGGMGLWLKRFGPRQLPGEHERSHTAITGAFREVTTSSTPATLRVLCDGLQTALGVVVRADGMILTKASEVVGKIECIFADGTRLPAEMIARRDGCDLALLRVSKRNLPVILWSEEEMLPVGSWLVSSGFEKRPIAIGVVSAPLQQSPMPKAVLGVRMYRVDEGVRVNLVMPGTGADRAGMRAGDVISTINGHTADSPETIYNVVSSLQPGDKVVLSVVREQEPLSLTAILGDMTRIGGMEQAELMDSLGGPLSKRRAGFPSVIQHDSIIQPRECGGPVVNLDGKAVGINIARVSRVATYALPAMIANEVAQQMLRETADLPPLRLPAQTVTTASGVSSQH